MEEKKNSLVIVLLFVCLVLVYVFVYRFFPASQSKKITPSITPTIQSAKPKQKIHKVLTIGYNPVENGVSFADTYFAEQMGASAEATENHVWSATQQAFNHVTGGLYQFEIVKSIHVTEPYIYPNDFTYTLESYAQCVYSNPDYNASFCEPNKYKFDYVGWIKDQHICEIAKEAEADEIWMLSLPYIMTWENFMIGPDKGFDVNGANYIVDTCDRHYIVINGTYDRPTNMLHNIGHRVEATMDYLTQNWQEQDRLTYWNKFSADERYQGLPHSAPYCGNAHFTHNSATAYQYDSKIAGLSLCSDWKNFPDFKGTLEYFGCEKWGCTDEGWQEYWLSSIPKNSNQLSLISKSGAHFTFPGNWWDLLLSPEAALTKKKEML